MRGAVLPARPTLGPVSKVVVRFCSPLSASACLILSLFLFPPFSLPLSLSPCLEGGPL